MIKPHKMNWGADIERDIPDEDILPERPPQFVVGELEIDPPNWAMKAISKPGGRRHPKREVTHIRQAYYTLPPDGDTSGIYRRALRRRGQSKNEAGGQAARKQVPAGNLKEDQYRFWKGNSFELFSAQCRWCNTHFGEQSKELFRKHHTNSQCKELLLALFKYAKKQRGERYCMACKKATSSERWGIPLCNTISCIARWKFGYRYTLPGFVQYLKWALEADANDAPNGPFAFLRESVDFAKGLSCLKEHTGGESNYYGGV